MWLDSKVLEMRTKLEVVEGEVEMLDVDIDWWREEERWEERRVKRREERREEGRMKGKQCLSRGIGRREMDKRLVRLLADVVYIMR